MQFDKGVRYLGRNNPRHRLGVTCWKAGGEGTGDSGGQVNHEPAVPLWPRRPIVSWGALGRALAAG